MKVGQTLFIPTPTETRRFLWPARGTLMRPRRTAGSIGNQGVEIRAGEGSLVRASRTGRVAVAARQVAGLGDTVILDHGDGYSTVYCGMAQVLVSPGAEIRQGNPVGRLGRAPLYFEIRQGTSPRDPLRALP